MPGGRRIEIVRKAKELSNGATSDIRIADKERVALGVAYLKGEVTLQGATKAVFNGKATAQRKAQVAHAMLNGARTAYQQGLVK
jgi:hypothetical protein